jgi:glycosyltransferase involved in cell wall biosynthesis
MRIAIITAGGAGMFCGSCMHDNALARALMALGHDVALVPTYTPIRVDEPDASKRRVFLGGINVYLDHALPYWGKLPAFLTSWLNTRPVLRLVNHFAGASSAAQLGALTVEMLRAEHGPQRREIDELAAYLARDLAPDCVCFSNALIAGVLPRLRRIFKGRIHCLLQGDDIFLDALVEPYRRQAFELLQALVRQFDGFLVHSRYYRDHMVEYLRIPRERLRVVPLGIDLAGHSGAPREMPHEPFTIGYFARIGPEKGLHCLVEAFRALHERHKAARLVAAGFLSAKDRPYLAEVARQARDLGDAFHYAGSPATHQAKVALLSSFDALCVPTVYREPKGLYVLEALANGVPVVQPAHGAFPELLEATGGGLLVPPGNVQALALALERMILEPGLRHELARRGWQSVRQNRSIRETALAMLQALSAS